jgi:chromate transporter
MTEKTIHAPGVSRAALVWEVFAVFLRLGLTSFGGPTAHIGYFRTAFVVQRRWLTEQRFAELVSVTQFLPGPASSQCGFGIGLLRAGWPGAFAAFCGFTLPSMLLMIAFAYAEPVLSGAWGRGLLHGLKLVAVAVVAHAVLGMARQLTPDAKRLVIAVVSASAVLIVGQWWVQLAAIALGAACGWLWCRDVPATSDANFSIGYGARLSVVLVVAFGALLLLSLRVPSDSAVAIRVVTGLYQSGALVFGGGHVVLPLLQQAMVATGLMSAHDFLAGYGAAQAVPGPMFSLSAYLGARLGGVPLALLAVAAIFLPGFLLLGAALPVWSSLVARPAARFLVAGVNAAVVGILAAAFYNPVWTTAIEGVVDILIAAAGFALLLSGRGSAIWVVVWCICAAMAYSVLA